MLIVGALSVTAMVIILTNIFQCFVHGVDKIPPITAIIDVPSLVTALMGRLKGISQPASSSPWWRRYCSWSCSAHWLAALGM